MKDLKQYTIESLLDDSSLTIESLLDDEDDLATNYEEIIWKFLHDNYNWTFNRDSYINIRYDKKDGYIVDSIVSVSFKGKLKNLTNGLFRWGKVKDFNCSFCIDLISLEGAPEECRNFTCNNCPNLQDLNGAPKKCKGFDCRNCPKLNPDKFSNILNKYDKVLKGI